MHLITREGKKVTATVTESFSREEAQTVVRDVEGILKEADHTGGRLLIDISSVAYLSSTGLGTLVRLFRAAKQAGMEMVVCCGQPEVRSLIEIAGLDRLIKLIDHPDEDQA